MQITMFTADCTGQAANCSYPNRRVVTTPEKLDELLPDISYVIAFSRNHMKVKDGKAARPKFHVYFQITETSDAGWYAALKRGIKKRFDFFDGNALDAARFIFGADVGEVVWHEGWMTIDEEVEADYVGAGIAAQRHGLCGLM